MGHRQDSARAPRHPDSMGSVLNTRSAAQTLQVMAAAYRRAGIVMPEGIQPRSSRSRTRSPTSQTAAEEQGQDTSARPTGQEADGVLERDRPNPVVPVVPEDLVTEMALIRQALPNQAVISGQVLDLIAHQPNNMNYVQLVEVVHKQSKAHTESSAHLSKMVASLESSLVNGMGDHIPPYPSRTLAPWGTSVSCKY